MILMLETILVGEATTPFLSIELGMGSETLSLHLQRPIKRGYKSTEIPKGFWEALETPQPGEAGTQRGEVFPSSGQEYPLTQ